MNAIGIIAFVAVILASIVLHEAGHFATAKFFGMKATRFFVGFGPTLWSTRRGETEYGVKAIPAGGFVKIVGMTPLEDIEPGDEDRAFYRQPARQRAVVLSAGSLVHFALAIVMTFGVLVFVGDVNRGTVTLASVPRCIYTSDTQTSCHAGDPASPAYGRLQAGDYILAVDGHSITSDDPNKSETALKAVVQAHPNTPVDFLVLRHGKRLHVSVTPAVVRVGAQTLPRLGVLLDTNVVPPHGYSPLAAVPHTFGVIGSYTALTFSAFGRVPHQVANDLKGGKQTQPGLTSLVGAARFSGEIVAAKEPLGVRIGTFLLLMGSLNFFIGLFNLLPLLPFDGGHLAILGFEESRRRLYRLIGRANPGRVDLNKVLPAMYAVFVLIVGLAVVLLYADIFHPLSVG